MSEQEIADQLGLDRSTVSVYMQRALKKIRRRPDAARAFAEAVWWKRKFQDGKESRVIHNDIDAEPD